MKKCAKARIIIKRMQLNILRPPSNRKEFWQIELINNLEKLSPNVVIETIRKHGQQCCGLIYDLVLSS